MWVGTGKGKNQRLNSPATLKFPVMKEKNSFKLQEVSHPLRHELGTSVMAQLFKLALAMLASRMGVSVPFALLPVQLPAGIPGKADDTTHTWILATHRGDLQEASGFWPWIGPVPAVETVWVWTSRRKISLSACNFDFQINKWTLKMKYGKSQGREPRILRHSYNVNLKQSY